MINRFDERIKSIQKAISFLFRVSPFYFIMQWVLSLIVACFPYLPLLLWKNILEQLIAESWSTVQKGLFILIVTIILYYLSLVLEKLLSVIIDIVSYRYNDEVDFYTDKILVKTISHMSYSGFDSSILKDKVQHATASIGSVTKNILRFLFELVQSIVFCTISFVVLFQVHWLIPLCIGLFTIPSICISKYLNKRSYQFRKKTVHAEREMNYYESLFNGGHLFEIKLYNLKDYFVQKYGFSWRELYAKKSGFLLGNILFYGLSVIGLTIVDLFIYVFCILRIEAQKMNIADFTFIVSIIIQFKMRFVGMVNDFNVFVELADEYSDIQEILKNEIQMESSGKIIPQAFSTIKFNHVTFKYPGSDKYVLKDCTFELKPNEIVGLVGVNGSGKSTIVKLLCRLYDPNEGQILLDGIDYKEYDLVKLRALFGILFQDYQKYALTLKENISMNLEEEYHEDRIKKACQLSKLTPIIEQWEQGIDEQLTKNFESTGKELSQGEWQRVALARALYQDRPFVLLDEPSASLDPNAEYEIFNSMKIVAEGKGGVLISHRLSSLSMVDQIMVLDDGKIIERGTHAELMEKQGVYASMYHIQAEKYT